MTPEGMVHALEDIHHLLRPGGCLIDIHPVVDSSLIEVHQDGRLLYEVPWPSDSTVNYHQADDALVQAVQRCLYSLERNDYFDYRVYGSSVEELCEYHAQADAYSSFPRDEEMVARESKLFAQAGEIQRLAGVSAMIATYEKVHIARLRPINKIADRI